MTKGKKWLYMAAGGLAALTLVFGAVYVFINTSVASAANAVGLWSGPRSPVWVRGTSC